jgi:hypothetical protein
MFLCGLFFLYHLHVDILVLRRGIQTGMIAPFPLLFSLLE